ncbi:MAG TPA: sugar ABC transporter permease [Anaerolineae bacterium]|nr:sugar ABC transporter permease [Anaerolineae bacterium]
MATKSVSSNSPPQPFITGRQKRAFSEYLTAYAFLLPAGFILFAFGIFPIFYAAYVSLYKWRIRQDEYRGLDNFVNAMGELAYIFLGGIALFFLVQAVRTLFATLSKADDAELPRWTAFISFPASFLITGGGTLILLRLVTFFTQEQAIEAGEASILGNIPLGLILVLVGAVLQFFIQQNIHRRFAPNQHTILPSFIGNNVNLTVYFGLGSLLLYYVYDRMEAAGHTRVVFLFTREILIGVSMMVAAYFIWDWAMRQFEWQKLMAGVVAAAVFITGSVYILQRWSILTRNGDEDFYLSLTVTVFYAIGAIPFQLAIALLLAYLLFQNIRGKGLFRVIFFIPYVAPTVAGAAIFDVLFSLRGTSLANRIVQTLTGDPDIALRWLREPGSVFVTLGGAFGIDMMSNWDFGPSLALLIIILFSIWRYVGYDTVIFLAGLGGIPTSLYEAAYIDGANRWEVFRHITLPLLSPTTFFLSVTSVIGTFKAFNSIYVLRNPAALGTTDTASIYFFDVFFRGARFGYATSMAIVLFIIILALTVLQNRLAERRVFYG